MGFRVVPFGPEHIEDAANLAARRYGRLREIAPDLPPSYADPTVTMELLSAMGEAPGVVALDGGRLAGFWRAWQRLERYGEATTYSPEWANGAEESDSYRIYGHIYASLSRQWAAEGHLAHYLTVFAHDSGAIEQLGMLGFGDTNGDGIRDLRPVDGAATDLGAGLHVRRAGPADRAQVLELWRLLARHILAAPVFQAGGADFDAGKCAARFDDPEQVIWVAERDGRVIAFMVMERSTEGACFIIRDEGTASITGAFTVEEQRGVGVASAVLDHAIAWAREEGYVRCSVDWETANLQANRFWPRHFTVICRSFGRRINPYVLSTTPP